MKAALVHDWLTGYRGGEKVLEVIAELLPDADIYTLIHVPGSVPPSIERHPIRTTWFTGLPGVRRYYRYFLPLMPFVAGRLTVGDYDLVVAVSHCVAHGVHAAQSRRFVAYYLTPMRYAWDMAEHYFGPRRIADPRYWLLRLVRPYLRAWDRRAAARVTEPISVSRCVQDRVRACYGRESVVIYPPVDTAFYTPLAAKREEFYLWVGALAPYKRIDLALEAFRQIQRPLVVIGHGQAAAWARRHAPANVTFLGWQPDTVIRDHYARCRALIFPGEEDFGIVPLEAQACCAPVIAYGKGGALESVRGVEPGESAPTGVFFREPSAEGLLDAIMRFERIEGSFDPHALRAHALGFSRDTCTRAISAYLFGKGER